MATVTDILRIAANEVGYSRWDDPESGTKYGRWYAQVVNNSYYGTNGVPYCTMFASWVFAQAGQSMPGLPTASCSAIVSNNRNTSRHVKNKKDAQCRCSPIDMQLTKEVRFMGILFYFCLSL